MRILSLNVGKPKTVSWRGREWTTAIYKEPVGGRLAVGALGFEADGQANLEVHGGTEKAVYSYAAEHYAFWKDAGRGDLPPGTFGENLTTEGLDEGQVRAGDRYRVGTAVLEAVSPRRPCAKLGLKFKDPGIVKEFKNARRPGIYFRVLQPGEIGAGDSIEKIGASPGAPTLVSTLG